jgi:3-hydroxyisobutyrate dehydrogenase-like beta-hydroxyacid dehydrogenase
MRLGFVGTGTMGSPMALCLIEAGHELTVYDVRPASTAVLVARGAHNAGSPADVAGRCEVVFTSLPGPSDVEHAVLDSSSGILAGLEPGGGYIDMTTNAPGVVRQIAEVCRARGVEMLDAPVSGRPPAMTVMAGGAASVFAKYRPLLAAMAGNIFHVGESGAGCVAKLVTQYLGYTNFVAALEGMLIGAKAGIDLAQLARIVLGPDGRLHRRRHP